MSRVVGKDLTIQKIQPILLELIKDDNSEVKLNVIEGYIKVASIVGKENINQFIFELTSLTKDGQWRVRMAIFELFGELGIKFGEEVFCKMIEEPFMGYLNNTAAAVRVKGVEKSGQLAEQFKESWIINNYIPKVTAAYNSDKKGYNYRICCLSSLGEVLKKLSKDQVGSLVVPLFMKAMKDDIPNVRFYVAKVINKNKKDIDPQLFAT